jgi:hypothetical protein
MPRSIALAVSLLLLASAASAGSPTLVARQRVGDAHALSLTATTDTDALSGGPRGKRGREDVALAYEATVTVLAVDAEGRPLRERHEQVRLSYERPDGTGSLFPPGATFEVERTKRGALRIFAGERRLDRKVEKVVGALLANRIEHSLLPALLDPGRPIAPGESWTLDRGLAKRLLRERGLRVVDFGDEAATARLEGDAEDAGPRRLHYRIPVRWLELARMPADTRTARSAATLEGELVLGPDGHARSHTAELVVRMNGVVVKTGVAKAAPWRLETSRVTAQRTEPIQHVASSGL